METEQTQTESTPLVPAALPAKRMGKIRASYLLTVEGLELLKKDKQVVLFPILSLAASMAVFIIFILLYWFFVGDTRAPVPEDRSGAGYSVLLILYLLLAFVTTFFQVGLTAVVDARINGKSMTFGEGMSAAKNLKEKVFLWSVVAATVGVVLSFISEKSQWLGKFTASFFGAAWGIATFFIVPALVLEDGNISGAIKSSASTFKKTWGETILVNFSTGIFLLLVALTGIIFSVLLAVVAGMFLPPIIATPIFFILFALLVMFLIGVAILSSAINSIFRVVLYEYAKSGHVSDAFAPELILGALKKSS